MTLTDQQAYIVASCFDSYNSLIKSEQDRFLERLLGKMAEQDLSFFTRGEDDFRDFAIKCYLKNVREKTAEWLTMLLNVETARDIVDGLDGLQPA